MKLITKKALQSFIFLLCLNSYSQIHVVKGVVKDSHTNERIPYANIYFKTEGETKTFGAMSNEVGEYNITNLGNVKEIIFSHLNYIDLTIKTNDLVNNFDILLNPKEFLLDEVIISKISAKDYLKNCIDNSSKLAEKSTLLNSYSREITKLNGEYLNISDAMIDYYITKSNGKSKLVINQSRSFIKDSSKLRKSLAVYDVKKFVKNAYDFNLIKKIIKDKNYQFEMISKKDKEGFVCYKSYQ